MNVLKNPKKPYVDYTRYSSNENINFHWRNILAIQRMTSSGDLWPPPDHFFGPLDRATKRPPISIEFKYHPTQKVSYRIKRVLIQILSGHVLKLILTEIFYGFLNIYKMLRILREQSIVKFQRPKITSDT